MNIGIMEIPVVTVEQMREIDCRMTEEFSISLLQMMELAGRNISEILNEQRRVLHNAPSSDVIVLAGKGNNGGGGLSAARHLYNSGWQVSVILPEPPASQAALRHLSTLQRMGIPIIPAANAVQYLNATKAGWIVDALIGYSLQGAPRPPLPDIIKAANLHDARILALDIPSGLCGDSGSSILPTIRADITLTLALPKTGLFARSAKEFIGELVLGDIGVPGRLLSEMGISDNFCFNHQHFIHLHEAHARQIQKNMFKDLSQTAPKADLCILLNPK